MKYNLMKSMTTGIALMFIHIFCSPRGFGPWGVGKGEFKKVLNMAGQLKVLIVLR